VLNLCFRCSSAYLSTAGKPTCPPFDVRAFDYEAAGEKTPQPIFYGLFRLCTGSVSLCSSWAAAFCTPQEDITVFVWCF